MAAESGEIKALAADAPAHKGQFGQANHPAGESEDQRPLPTRRAGGGRHEQQ